MRCCDSTLSCDIFIQKFLLHGPLCPWIDVFARILEILVVCIFSKKLFSCLFLLEQKKSVLVRLFIFFIRRKENDGFQRVRCFFCLSCGDDIKRRNHISQSLFLVSSDDVCDSNSHHRALLLVVVIIIEDYDNKNDENKNNNNNKVKKRENERMECYEYY